MTQIVLGAAVGEAVLGRKIGNRAMIAGAIFGTLPDLDVLIPFNDAIASFTYHRSFSHSWLILSVLSPVLAWLTKQFAGDADCTRWWLLIFLTLNTHVLLDCFTVYGTQALWPLTHYPIGWATIFIVDPLYTIPLLIGLLVALRRAQDSLNRQYANWAGLLLSSCYLAWTVIAHEIVVSRATIALHQSSVEFNAVLVTPTPLSLLWRINAISDDSYYEGFHALTDSSDIQYERYPRQPKLRQELKDHWPVKRLDWFTRDFYALNEINDVIYMTDLRMGIEASYVFTFRVARRHHDCSLKEEVSVLQPFRPDLARFKLVFSRMLDETVSLLPPPASEPI